MKKRLIVSFLALLVLVGAGCSQPEPSPTATIAPTVTLEPTNTPTPEPPTPEPTPTTEPTPFPLQSLLAAANEAMGNVESYHFEMDMQMSMSQEGLSLDIPIMVEGNFQAPDQMQGTMSFSLLGFDVQSDFIQIGEMSYSTDPQTGEWYLGSDADSPFRPNDLFGFDPTSPGEVIGSDLGRTDALSFIGVQTLDGTPAYHLVGEIPQRDLNIDAADAEGNLDVEMWLGVDDSLVRQISLAGEIPVDETTEILPGMATSEPIGFTLEMAWSDFGQEVVIVAPEVVESSTDDSAESSAEDESVLDIAFSPDGQTLASAGTSGIIRLYHISEPDNDPIAISAHDDWIRALAFSPDGQLLASTGDDRTVKLWDMADLEAEPIVLNGHEDWVRRVAFTPDGQSLLSAGDDRGIRLWDLSDLEAEPAVLTGHIGWIKSLAICPDGLLMASVDDEGGLLLWDMTEPDAEAISIESDIFSTISVACSPDSQMIAWTGDFLINFLDLADPEAGPVTSVDYDSLINFLAFSPDGQYLATGDDNGSVILWDLNNLDSDPVVLTGHESWVNSVAFSPDGRLLASADATGRVRLWDVENPESDGVILGPVEQCSDSLGCVEVGPDEAILLASSLVMSGPNAELGLDSQRGIELAIDFKGKILGHSIEFLAEDGGCNAQGGQVSATKIVSDPQIVAMIGTSCSGAAIPAATIIGDAGYVMVSPSNTSPALTDPDLAWQPGYLRTAPNDALQGAAMAEFAFNELGVTKAAVIHDGDPNTEGLARFFVDSFQELGGEIVAFETAAADATDVDALLRTIAENGPELIYYPVYIPLGALITNTARDIAALDGVMLAVSDALVSPVFRGNTVGTSEEMYISSPDLSSSVSFYGGAFLPAYIEKYGTEPPTLFHAYAYDATMMVLQAIKEVARENKEGTLLIGRQALRDALYAMSNFYGLTGLLTCNQYGDCANPVILINQIQNGDIVRIWPEE